MDTPAAALVPSCDTVPIDEFRLDGEASTDMFMGTLSSYQAKSALKGRSVLCPRCHVERNADLLLCGDHKTAKDGDRYNVDAEMVLRCGNETCRKIFIMSIPDSGNIDKLDLAGKSHTLRTMPASSLASERDLIFWRKANVPHLAIEAYKDGCRAMANGIPRPACIMFRSCIEKIVENKSDNYNPKDKLAKKIRMSNLPENIKKIAHQIRLMGNDCAHFGFEQASEAIDKDAENMFTLINKIIKDVYVADYEVEQIIADSEHF